MVLPSLDRRTSSTLCARPGPRSRGIRHLQTLEAVIIGVMLLATDIAAETLRLTLQAAPFILLGLLVAGFVHVLVPERLVLRWMGGPGLAGAARAAAIGVPLPVCSCGVVPLAVELRRKGASQPATVSFLVTTPESSLDSILLTWGLMGPVMAIARPIAAFVTAMLGAVFAIADRLADVAAVRPSAPDHPDDHDHQDDHEHHHDHGDGHNTEPHGHGCEDGCDTHHRVASPHGDRARAALLAWGNRLRRRPVNPEAPSLWSGVGRPALDYGLRELLDDLAFWLAAGLVLGGILAAVLPDDLGALGLGGGIAPLLLMLVIGLPLYTCASASTPVAAALVAKGLSPGAALVFLLAGPATSLATMMLLASHFGRRFVVRYVAAVAIGALAAGLLFDALVDPETIRQLGIAAAEKPAGLLEWLSGVVLVGLLVWRFVHGAWRSGWNELRGMSALPLRSLWRWLGRRGVGARRLATLAGAAVLLWWAGSGFGVVGPDAKGYGFVFGRLVAADLDPGLHWLPPAPFGRLEVRRVGYARKADVGFRTDLDLLARRRELTRAADRDAWHSPVAAMNANPIAATYVTADENLVEIALTVHYGLVDPRSFFYGLDHRVDLVGLYAETVARELVAARQLDELLTTGRLELEAGIAQGLGARLDAVGLGVVVRQVEIVDVHPPGDAVFAFRDVSTAREERETAIHRARTRLAWEVPTARGEAVRSTTVAAADAAARVTRAVGEASQFSDRARVVAGDRALLRSLLAFESAERQVVGADVLVVPAGAQVDGLELWRSLPDPAPAKGGSPP